MANPITRQNFADALDPAFRKFYSDAERELPYVYRSIFNVLTSNKNIEKDSGISGLGTLVEKAEGAAITSDTLYQGYDSTYTHKTYALKTSITKEMIADDQFREVEKRAKGLAIAGNRSVETAASDVLNYGWTSGGGGKAAFLSGGDAKALFASDHPRSDGGTAQSNTTTMDLAEDSIETILVAMRETLDDRGQLMLVRPDKLVIPPALEKEAKILLNSSQRIGTANNDINPYEGVLTPIVWPYIANVTAGGSDTAYSVLDSNLHSLNFFWRQQPNLENNDDFDTKDLEYSLDARWSCGFSGWRGTFGSKGDNS